LLFFSISLNYANALTLMTFRTFVFVTTGNGYCHYQNH
jgi:hypothetical protein